MKFNIGILCSGELGFDILQKLSKKIEIQFIFTDNKSDSIKSYANKNMIPLFIGNPRNYDSSIFLKKFKTDIIFSINYIFIVQKEILKHPKYYAINIHGSLLPKFRGRTPHVWAIINGERETGVTAHIMEEGCDTGDIVMQKIIEICDEDTGADVLNKYMRIYPLMIIELIEIIKNNDIKRIAQDNNKATYFGKRVPEDGLINWDWQKERIYNWVRAQALPYPGAFSYLNNQKVIIDRICYSEYGYDNNMPNGLILKTEPEVLVKTPNGVVELSKVRGSTVFIKNEIFNFHENRKF